MVAQGQGAPCPHININTTKLAGERNDEQLVDCAAKKKMEGKEKGQKLQNSSDNGVP